MASLIEPALKLFVDMGGTLFANICNKYVLACADRGVGGKEYESGHGEWFRNAGVDGPDTKEWASQLRDSGFRRFRGKPSKHMEAAFWVAPEQNKSFQGSTKRWIRLINKRCLEIKHPFQESRPHVDFCFQTASVTDFQNVRI